MGRAPCLLLNLLPHRFGVWISRLAVKHAPSAFKVFAKDLAPFPPSCQRTPSPLSDCPLEMLWQEEFSCRLCCRGLQFQDPTSAFSKCFCIPFLCFSACVLSPEVLHVVVPCPSAHLLRFPWGSTAVPGSLRAGSSLMLSSVLKKTLSKWTRERSQTCTFAHIYVCFTALFELHLSCQNDSFLLESCSPA